MTPSSRKASLVLSSAVAILQAGCRDGILIGSVGKRGTLDSGPYATETALPIPVKLVLYDIDEDQCTIKDGNEIPLQEIDNYQILTLLGRRDQTFDILVDDYPPASMDFSKVTYITDECTPSFDRTPEAIRATSTVKRGCKGATLQFSPDAPPCKLKIIVKPI